uniref:Uncharacterized protein n=1 Tax=Strombidium rassoulzadegani TaxID=1082188 RepID=A0A7S3CLF3_9SPIT
MTMNRKAARVIIVTGVVVSHSRHALHRRLGEVHGVIIHHIMLTGYAPLVGDVLVMVVALGLVHDWPPDQLVLFVAIGLPHVQISVVAATPCSKAPLCSSDSAHWVIEVVCSLIHLILQLLGEHLPLVLVHELVEYHLVVVVELSLVVLLRHLSLTWDSLA